MHQSGSDGSIGCVSTSSNICSCYGSGNIHYGSRNPLFTTPPTCTCTAK
jgi:hypothetical protein